MEMSPANTARRAPRVRRTLIALTLVIAGLAAGYVFWLRDSSLVRVQEVTVTGLTTAGTGGIRATLTQAAEEMTTLNVDVDALEEAVASEPAVAGLRVDRELPHGLTLEVIERQPVATVEGPEGREVAVAEDGILLPDAAPAGSLTQLPATVPSVSGQLEDERGLEMLAAVAASPPALARHIETVERDGEEGLMATLEAGPLVVLGDATRLDAKWAAAAAAIADGDAAAAGYVDVSLPERPAAGG
jgi:cell division protein FtsQ